MHICLTQNKKQKKKEKPKFIPEDVFSDIQAIFRRLDEKKSGYAPFREL